jgi:hypothetical protein
MVQTHFEIKIMDIIYFDVVDCKYYPDYVLFNLVTVNVVTSFLIVVTVHQVDGLGLACKDGIKFAFLPSLVLYIA